MAYARTKPSHVAAQVGVGAALAVVCWKSLAPSSPPQEVAEAIGDQQSTDLDRSVARELAQPSPAHWEAQRAASGQGKHPGGGS